MTASEPDHANRSGPGPEHFDSFDSTAQLMSQITAQLSSQLSRVTLRAGRAGSPGPGPVLVAVAHGSRDPEAARTVRALLDRVRDLRPDLPVRLGHIEIDEPSLDDTLAALRGGTDVVLVPLLLGRGYHVKQDLPRALARAPHLRGRMAAPLGPHPLLAEALRDRLAEAGWRAPRPERAARSGVVLAAAGSRDPDSARDTARTAALLRRLLGGIAVLPAYASEGPTVADSVATLAGRGRHHVAVASYFTAPGRFAAQTAAAAPWIAAAPLGAHPAMADLIIHRYDQALAACVGTVLPEPARA
jgi:sirohydrochlorin ferrochelatase